MYNINYGIYNTKHVWKTSMKLYIQNIFIYCLHILYCNYIIILFIVYHIFTE